LAVLTCYALFLRCEDRARWHKKTVQTTQTIDGFRVPRASQRFSNGGRLLSRALWFYCYVQAENFDTALDDLMKIGVNCNEAIQQLDELVLIKHKGTDPSKGFKE